MVENLKIKKTKMVIIFNYSTDLDDECLYKINREHNKIKEKLLNYGEDDDKNNYDLKNKIKVICNSGMFKLKLSFKEQYCKNSESEEKVLVNK